MIGHRVVLRPRSILETGDLALVLLQRHAGLFVRLFPWVLAPAALAWGLHAFAGFNAVGAVLIELTLLALTSGVYTLLCGDLMLTKTASLRDIQRRFLRSLFGFGWARLVGALAAMISVGLAYSYVAFIPEGKLLERGSTRETLERSRALLKETQGRSLALAMVLPFLAFAGAGGAELVRFALRAMSAMPIQPLTDLETNLSWAIFLGIALMQPYIAVFRFLLYIDCRTRREGWDLQVQFSALASAQYARRSAQAA